MRDERDFERALEAIANGSSIRRCALPKSTLLSRAEREPAFERRLAAAQQNGCPRLVSTPLVPGGKMDREELIAIIADQARQGRGWACRTMLELLDAEPGGSRIPSHFLRALGDG